MTKYVALYCRLSPRPDGSYEGVDAQEKWGRDYAANAWPGMSVRVFADAGISAANGDHRPQFEALREAIARGEVAHLWTVEQSRLERTEVGWFKLAAELDAAGIAELHTNRDGVVRVRDEVAGIKAVLAAGEVRKLRSRVNDRLMTLAAEGRPAGARVFGYRRGTDESGKKTLLIDEREAAEIREAAERVLAGWSLSRIAGDLRARGWHGPHRRKIRNANNEVIDSKPSTITQATVRGMLTNPTVAGKRVHQGRIVGPGVWPAIIDDQTWHAVRNKLAAPRVVERADGGTYPITGRPANTGRRYLLTGGIAVCGVCNAPLKANMKQLSRKLADGSRVLWKVAPYYSCHSSMGGNGCVGIMGEQFEEHVIGELLAELDKPAFRDALAVDEHAGRRDELAAALRSIEDDQRPELAKMWAAKELTADEWRTARRALTEHEDQLRADLAAVPPAVAHIDPAVIVRGWAAMNLDERREIAGMFIECVTVKRAEPGTKRFDVARVAIEWRRR